MSDNQNKLTLEDAHVRNLLIGICHQLIRLRKNRDTISFANWLDFEFTENDLIKKLYIREYDKHIYLQKIFDKKDDRYTFSESKKYKLGIWLKKYEDNSQSIETQVQQYIDIYDAYKNKIMRTLFSFDIEAFHCFEDEVTSLIETLHWGTLPLYEDDVIVEHDKLPEDDVLGYYRGRYSSYRELYNWVKENTKWKPSLKGDCNLGRSMQISIYNRRWGHEDIYTVIREFDPNKKWKFRFQSGEGDIEWFFKSLEHDGVQFPQAGVTAAFDELWEMADETEMSVKELEKKLQEVGTWISQVEIAVGRYQPEWCRYY